MRFTLPGGLNVVCAPIPLTGLPDDTDVVASLVDRTAGPVVLVGHAYALYGHTSRQIAGDGVLLIGDAVGLAYAQSGEGIRPAIESGLLAAKVVVAAQGCYSQERLEAYRDLLVERFGQADSHWLTRLGQRVPSGLVSLIGRRLMATEWFCREVVLNRWFLRQHKPVPCVT